MPVQLGTGGNNCRYTVGGGVHFGQFNLAPAAVVSHLGDGGHGGQFNSTPVDTIRSRGVGHVIHFNSALASEAMNRDMGVGHVGRLNSASKVKIAGIGGGPTVQFNSASSDMIRVEVVGNIAQFNPASIFRTQGLVSFKIYHTYLSIYLYLSLNNIGLQKQIL